ncbi:ATP-binding cassette domain-containing protein [Acidobacteria bacterium AH-259-D05]|nr:ATP-binding cassette domain-containing protein [Acidobacteria bacterium AH-259-D05]
MKNYFPVRGGVFSRVGAWVKAVDDVSFEIGTGETLGLVGESGCGKTTVGHSILRLIEPTAGTVEFEGKDLTDMPPAQLRATRQHMQIIFQDPFSSLNPRMTVGAIIGEALAIHGRGSRRERAQIVRDTLEKCGLDPAYINRFPHEFSGGQRQRIGIARALALSPKFIVCDEPVSALDVSIQSQIINLLAQLKERYDLAYLFIAHDLSVVEYISDRVAVMYLGKIVEIAESSDLYRNPLHPYTQALLSAVPIPDPTKQKERTILPGDVPSPLNPPAGCRFHPRCPLAVDICKRVEPRELDVKGHKVWCHVVEEQMGIHHKDTKTHPEPPQ